MSALTSPTSGTGNWLHNPGLDSASLAAMRPHFTSRAFAHAYANGWTADETFVKNVLAALFKELRIDETRPETFRWHRKIPGFGGFSFRTADLSRSSSRPLRGSRPHYYRLQGHVAPIVGSRPRHDRMRPACSLRCADEEDAMVRQPHSPTSPTPGRSGNLRREDRGREVQILNQLRENPLVAANVKARLPEILTCGIEKCAGHCSFCVT